jgi:hypothetical protein
MKKCHIISMMVCSPSFIVRGALTVGLRGLWTNFFQEDKVEVH